MRKLFIICALLFCLGTASAQQKFSVDISRREAEACVGHSNLRKWPTDVKYGETAAAGGLQTAGIRVRQVGEFGAGLQGGKGTKEENRRGLRAGSGEGPQ